MTPLEVAPPIFSLFFVSYGSIFNCSDNMTYRLPW